MKSLIFKITCLFLILCIASSCTVLDKYSASTYVIDLSEFERNGIFVTTGDISSTNYQSVAIISVDCYSGAVQKENAKVKIDKPHKGVEDDIYYTSVTSATDKKSDFLWRACLLEDLFSTLIINVKELEANGIINLEIKNVTQKGASGNDFQKGIEVIGIAVKIE